MLSMLFPLSERPLLASSWVCVILHIRSYSTRGCTGKDKCIGEAMGMKLVQMLARAWTHKTL